MTAAQVARAAGADLAGLRFTSRSGDQRATVLDAMARGATSIVADLRAAGRCSGAMGLGGSGGSTIISAVLRSLPLGVPKLLVSTMASGDVRSYVGTSDLTLVYPVTDVQGLNRVSRLVLANAASAMAGMVARIPLASTTERALVAITMQGVTTPAVQGVQARLEAAGFETIVFHATGSGGQAMEELIDAGVIDGVVDLTTNELTSERYGGILSAGPGRLTAAGRAGIPQVVAPGALEVINFGPRSTLPARYDVPGRRMVIHSPSITSVRADPEEAAEMGRILAARVNAATGPAAVVLPLGGCSKYELPGGPFVDPEGDAVLFGAIRAGLRADIACGEVEANINEPAFADLAVSTFLELWSRVRPLPEPDRYT